MSRPIDPATAGRCRCAGVLFGLLAATNAGAQLSFFSELQEPFDKIEVHAGGTVAVEFGARSRAVLADGASSGVRIAVQSGTLHVTCPSPCADRVPKMVRVTAPRLSAIRVRNGGKVQTGEGFPKESQVAIEISGGGVIDAASLPADVITVAISGGGIARVSATKRLDAHVSGGGIVNYFGDPDVAARTSGGGIVKRVGASRPTASVFVDPRDGQRYGFAAIGKQKWMTRNLAFLPRVCEAEDAECGIWVYGFSGTDVKLARQSSENQQNGALYSWKAAQTACPAGWHLPGDEEWQQLEMALGMSAADAASGVWRGSDEGTAVKAGGSSGLNVLLAGWRTSYGKFNFAGEHANFWTASEADAQHAIERLVGAKKQQIGRHTGLKGCGFSVRCVQD